jgi:sugar (pentulose or hexulose) kinase
MDIRNVSYSEDIFDFCEISECKEKLPEIIPSMNVCGYVTKRASRETGLEQGTPVISGAHDIAASSYGAGGNEEGHLTIILGTLGLNLLVINDSRNGEIGDGVIRHTIPERWLALNCELSSGSSLEWFIHTYCQDEIQESLRGEGSVYEIIEKKIETSSSSGLIYHPFINGRIDQNSARAGLYGLSAWHSKSDIFKSVYEGIAFGHCQLIDDDFSKTVNIKTVSLVGGGARSRIWGQVFADILGQPVFIPGIEEITSRGVALCAGVGAGIYENLERANKVPLPLKREYYPDSVSREGRLGRYNLFKKIDNNMREIWDEMAKL